MGCRISGCCLLDRKRPVNCRPFPRYLHFESLLLRIFGRRQERRQCSAHRFFAGKAARDIAGQRHRARVPEICRGLDVGESGECGTLARCAQQGVCFACFCTSSRRGAKPLCLVMSGARWRLCRRRWATDLFSGMKNPEPRPKLRPGLRGLPGTAQRSTAAGKAQHTMVCAHTAHRATLPLVT